MRNSLIEKCVTQPSLREEFAKTGFDYPTQ